jgi:hypothetical protein
MQVVERAITLDPEERYAGASELLAALSDLKFGSRRVVWLVPFIAIVLSVAGMIALGALTSTALNISLKRSGFVHETIWDFAFWGRKTSVPPLFMLMLTLLAMAPLLVARRLLIALSDRIRAFDGALRKSARTVIHRYHFDEAPVLASCALAVSAASVAAAWWYFRPLLGAVVTDVSTGPASDLALLSPAFVGTHNQYRWAFFGVIALSVALWYPVATLIRSGQTLHPAMWCGGVAIVAVALVFLHLPYRQLYFSDTFEVVEWNGARCYVVGERDSVLLMMCPDLEPPRRRTTNRRDPALVALGVSESIYSRFVRRAQDGEASQRR